MTILRVLAAAALLTLFALTSFAIDKETLQKKLKELKELRENEVITADEYEQGRKDLLSQYTKEGQSGATTAPAPPAPPAPPAGGAVVVPSFACNYSGGPVQNDIQLAAGFAETADVSDAVSEIVAQQGLVQNFIVRTATVPNAMATMFGSERYVLYDPEFFSKIKSLGKTNWTIYSILAHEIGHHLQGHVLRPGGSQPKLELEADEFSGFVLARLGASLDDAQAAMSKFGSEQGSTTHPGRKDRLEAIKRGWTKGKEKKSGKNENDPPFVPEERKKIPARGQDKDEIAPNRKPCTHKVPCKHPTPCQHAVACQHRVPCQHLVACQHTYLTPNGLMRAHPADALHPFDLLHPADAAHPADAQHPFDLAHPEGDR